MLRNMTKLLTIVAGLTLSGQAFAQASDSETTTASVTLAAPITLEEDSALRFGSVLKGTTGITTVTVNEITSARTYGGDGNAVLIAGATPTRASYTVTGETGATFAISITDDTIDLTGPGSGLLALTLLPSATSDTLTGVTATFGVGGTLTIDNTDADVIAGTYSGDFEVTVQYQ